MFKKLLSWFKKPVVVEPAFDQVSARLHNLNIMANHVKDEGPEVRMAFIYPKPKSEPKPTKPMPSKEEIKAYKASMNRYFELLTA